MSRKSRKKAKSKCNRGFFAVTSTRIRGRINYKFSTGPKYWSEPHPLSSQTFGYTRTILLMGLGLLKKLAEMQIAT